MRKQREPQRVRAETRRQESVVLVRDPTNLDTRHDTSRRYAASGLHRPPRRFTISLLPERLKPMKPAKAAVPVQLDKVEDEFVGLWNNMASLWGISPTMARIHGLLYITGASLSMD